VIRQLIRVEVTCNALISSPDFEPGMWLEGAYGFDDLEEMGASAGANIPVSETLASRFDGSIRARDGYVTDLISGDDMQTTNRSSLRGQALWDISDDASLRIIVDRAERMGFGNIRRRRVAGRGARTQDWLRAAERPRGEQD
jgi:hypothetical protein